MSEAEVGLIPCSPTRNSSYDSQVTTPPARRLQPHFMTPQRTYGHLACRRSGRVRDLTHRRLRQQQLLAETVPVPPERSIGAEVIADKAPGGQGIGRRSERQEQERHIQG